MDIFETKLRGFHARTIQNIMARTSTHFRTQTRQKSTKPKTDNITTYLRKFEIDRENLNLAKRILLCESEHNHKFYLREWKKTKNFIRVRSNFKRGLSNEQPRIFKFEPIRGLGSCLVTINFLRFESNLINFKPENTYQIKALVKNNSIEPTNSLFCLQSISNNPMCLYVPSSLRKKKLLCKISQIKQNDTYDKGRFAIDLGIETEQTVEIVNKQNKLIANIVVKIDKEPKDRKKQRYNNNSLCVEDVDKEEHENQGDRTIA